MSTMGDAEGREGGRESESLFRYYPGPIRVIFLAALSFSKGTHLFSFEFNFQIKTLIRR